MHHRGKIPLPTNPYGRVHTAPRATSAICSGGPRGTCTDPQVPPAATHGLESLYVSHLFSQEHLTGTVVVQGMGKGNRLGETGLCVRTGARVDGHSALNSADMVGDLSVAGDVGARSTLTVDSLRGMKAGGLPAGPLQIAESQAKYVSALVSISTVAAGGVVKQVMGVAVSPTLILTVNNWQASDPMQTVPVAPLGTVPFTITVRDATSGEKSFAGLVVARMPTANVALVCIARQPSSPHTFATYLGIEDVQDVCTVGEPVLIGSSNLSLGVRTFTLGHVAASSIQMYAEFTSLYVTAPQVFLGGFGAPIVNLYGKIVAMVQHGVPDAGATNVVNTQVLGGARGRYLKYFLDNARMGTGVLTPLPTAMIGGSKVLGRALRPIERSPAFKPGGVVVAPTDGGVLGTDAQVLRIAYVDGGGARSQYALGNVDSNTPSISDGILALHPFITETTPLVFVKGPADSASLTNTLYTWAFTDLGTSPGWTAGAPWMEIARGVGSLTSDFIIEKAGGNQDFHSIMSAGFSLTVDDTFVDRGQTYGTMTFGSSSDASNTRSVMVAWGAYSVLQRKLVGIPSFGAAWASWVQAREFDQTNWQDSQTFTILAPIEGTANDWASYSIALLNQITPGFVFNVVLTAGRLNVYFDEGVALTTVLPRVTVQFVSTFDIFGFASSTVNPGVQPFQDAHVQFVCALPSSPTVILTNTSPCTPMYV